MSFDNCIHLCYFQPNKDIGDFYHPRKFPGRLTVAVYEMGPSEMPVSTCWSSVRWCPGGGAFGRFLGHGGGGPMNGSHVPIKSPWGLPCRPPGEVIVRRRGRKPTVWRLLWFGLTTVLPPACVGVWGALKALGPHKERPFYFSCRELQWHWRSLSLAQGWVPLAQGWVPVIKC